MAGSSGDYYSDVYSDIYSGNQIPEQQPPKTGFEWYTLDDSLRRDQVIEGFQSFIWTERYSSAGDFVIVTKTTYNNRLLLSDGTRIAMKGSRYVMKIDTVSDDTGDDGSRNLTVTGKSLEMLLDDRVAMGAITDTTAVPTWNLTGTPGDIIRSMFEQICVAGILSPNDNIPFYVNGLISPVGDIPEPDEIVTVSASPDTLYNTIQKIATTYGLGFRLIKNQDLGQLYFEVYMGNDLTTGQTDRNPVIFDRNLDNLVKPSLLRSSAILKTVAYVFAQNGAVVVYAPNSVESDSGADRRVLLVNSSNTTPATKVAGFVTDSNSAHQCFLSDSDTTASILSVPTSFVSGSDPSTSGVQDGFAATPILGYRAFAQFKCDVLNTTYVQNGVTYNPNGPIDTSIYEWVRYDIEEWADTPSEESDDPEQYIQTFIHFAHDNGFKVMVTPARDLGNTATVHPKVGGEDLDTWYLRVGVAQWCFEADIYEVQDQANQGTKSDFVAFFTSAHDQIRQVNPTIPVWCGISTTYGDGEVMFNSARAVWDIADGYWINVVGDTANGVDFMTRWLAFTSTIDTGLLTALAQEGLQALSVQRNVYSFDGELPQSNSYVYGVDYNLGDVVEERTEDGFKNQMIVTEQIFTSDDTGDRSYPTLSILQTITPGSWLAEPVAEVWDTVDSGEHWNDL